MISFHPTIPPFTFGKYLWQSLKASDTLESLTELFPDQQTVLVDSGRSALAVVIETLELQGSSMILPAYVCDVLYPVLKSYNIQPIFVDVDADTYQPALSAYSDEILANADAVLLIATYGRITDAAILKHLQDRDITIIEDFAGRSPFLNDPLAGSARIYSLPKTLPVPDGGLAVIPKGTTASPLASHRLSLSFVKNVLKLLPGVAPLIARIRDGLGREQSSPSWDGTYETSKLTKTILINYLSKPHQPFTASPYSYCQPLHTRDPEQTITSLHRLGLSAERIWQRPIVANLDVQADYLLRAEDYPVTFKLASEIVCAPLWQIKDGESLKLYQIELEKTLT